VVDAFNAWFLAERREAIARIRGNPEKYGPWELHKDEPFVQERKPATAVHFF
jgi:hypothetical protein